MAGSRLGASDARLRRKQAPTPNPHDLQQAIHVRFKDEALLTRALTHRSYLNEHPDEGRENYERLEFLGDAFLGWVIADELFKRHPQFSEGEMTRARALLVKGPTLAEIARAMDLGPHIELGAGEEATGGRDRRNTLAAVVEAVIGAVLLDRGEAAARKLVLRWLGARLDVIETGGAPRDGKSALQEVCQKRGLDIPMYETVNEAGPSHDRRYEVRVLVGGQERGRGNGRRKVDAEQMAAAQALATMGSAS